MKLFISLCIIAAVQAAVLDEFLHELPSWVTPTSKGTVCGCAYLADASRALVAYRYRSFGGFREIDPNYKCSCIDGQLLNQDTESDFTVADVDGTNLCSNQSINVTAAYDATATACIDPLGFTCGGNAGVRISTMTELSTSTFVDPATDLLVSGQYCAKLIARVECTTPSCNSLPLDCKLANEYEPWGSCIALGAKCVKKRVLQITQNATTGGYPCPSIEERTQTIDCIAAECAAIPCVTSTYKITGNCSASCGVATQNVTTYRITSTLLDRCVASNNTPVSYETVDCTSNLPCKNDSTTIPIDITCATVGNAGFRGAAPRYIEVRFQRSVSFNHTNLTLATSFKLTDTLSGRRYGIKANESYFSGSSLFLRLLVPEDSMLGLTGSIFQVDYTPVLGARTAIYVGSAVINGFKCITTDESPPVMLAAFVNSLDPETELPSWGFVFSEIIKISGSDPGYMSYADFNFTGFTDFDPNYRESSVASIGVSLMFQGIVPYSAPDPPPEGEGGESTFHEMSNHENIRLMSLMTVLPNASVWINYNSAGVNEDFAGNKLVNGGFRAHIPFQILGGYGENQTYSFPDGVGSIYQAYSNNSNGIVDSVQLTTIVPYQLATLTQYLSDIKLQATYTDANLSFTVSYNAVRYVLADAVVPLYETSDPHGLKPTLHFAVADDNLPIALGHPNASVTYNFIWFYEAGLMLDPGDFFVRPLYIANATVTSVQGPRIVNATGTSGTSTVVIQFSGTSANGQYSVSDFLLKTTRSLSFASILSQTATTVTLSVSEVLNFTDFVGASVIHYDLQNQGILSTSSAPLNDSLGSLPAIKSVLFLNTLPSDSNVWTQARIVFDAPVDASTTASFLTFNTTNPFITAITPTSIAVEDDVATVELTVDCTGYCADTSRDASVSATSVSSVTGASSLLYQQTTIRDITPPKLVSVTEIDKKYLFVFSEGLTTPVDTSGIHPRPESCEEIPDYVARCLFAGQKTTSDVFLLSKSAAVGRDGISSEDQYSNPLEAKSCGSRLLDSLDDPWSQAGAYGSLVAGSLTLLAGLVFGVKKAVC
jgi:hypothetical protein